MRLCVPIRKQTVWTINPCSRVWWEFLADCVSALYCTNIKMHGYFSKANALMPDDAMLSVLVPSAFIETGPTFC